MQSYQVTGTGNKTYDACQASGSQWGQAVSSWTAGGCPQACGMYHYASLSGGAGWPIGTYFGNPSLVISAEDYPKEITTETAAWGFLCPLLRDQSTGYVLEYCLERSGEATTEYNAEHGYEPSWSGEQVRACESGIGAPGPLLVTQFAPGTHIATTRQGSTYVWAAESQKYPKQYPPEEAGHREHYEAAITPQNLSEAVGAFNTKCGAHASTNAANYALIGIEQGREPWSAHTNIEVGGSSANLSARTEYSSLWTPGETNTWAMSRPNEEMHAAFPGASSGALSDWYGIPPSWAFHEFPLSGFPPAQGYPSVLGRADGELDMYYRGPGGHLELNYESSQGGQWNKWELGCCAAGDPAALERANGEIHVFFRGGDNGIYDWYYSAGQWHSTRLGGSTEMQGKPSGFERANGEIHVFFRGRDNGIYDLYYNGGTFEVLRLGCCAASDPVAVQRRNGEIDVFFRGTNNALDDIWYSGGTWSGPAELTSNVEGTPSAYERTNGELLVFYRAPSPMVGTIWNAYAAPGASHWSFAERACCAVGDPSPAEGTSGVIRVFLRVRAPVLSTTSTTPAPTGIRRNIWAAKRRKTRKPKGVYLSVGRAPV